MRKPKNHILVIFGASGDLTKRKLIPALADLHHQELLPENFAVLGLGRTDLSDEQFRDKMSDGVKEFASKKEREHNDFLDQLYYYSFNTKEESEYEGFRDRLEELDQEVGSDGNFIFYLATPPSMYPLVPKFLADQGLNKSDSGFRRLIVEKPFGYDLERCSN